MWRSGNWRRLYKRNGSYKECQLEDACIGVQIFNNIRGCDDCGAKKWRYWSTPLRTCKRCWREGYTSYGKFSWDAIWGFITRKRTNGYSFLCLRAKEFVILWRPERAMVRAMCGVKMKDKKSILDLVDMLGLNETLDKLPKSNGIR